MNRMLIPVLSVLWIGSLAYSQTAPTSAAGDTVTVARGKLPLSVEADGYFEPVEPAEITIRPESYQGDLRVLSGADPGAAVKAGDVILEIDPADLKPQLAEAENAAVAARANLAKARSDAELGEQADALALKMAEDRLATAKANLKWFDDVDGKEMLTNAELNVRRNQAAVEDQADELDQLKKMYKTEELTNATADIVVKRAVRQLELAKVGLEMSQARQQRVREFDHATARQKLLFAIDQETQNVAQTKATGQANAVLKKTAVETARLALEKAEQKLAELRKDREAFTVHSPIDGVVYYGQLSTGTWQNANPRQLRPGEKVAAGQVVLTVVKPGQLRFVADVPEAKADYFAAGAAARVVPTARPQVLTGKVEQIASVGRPKDNLQLYPTKIDLDSASDSLRPGMRGTAHIQGGSLGDALLVPASAVSKSRVKLKKGDDFVWQDVIVGKSDGAQVQILDGVKEGDVLLKDPK